MSISSIIETTLYGEITSPVLGDVILFEGRLCLFCGAFKGKWILAEENLDMFVKRKWDYSVIEPSRYKPTGAKDEKTARRIYELMTTKPLVPGTPVKVFGENGFYVRQIDDLGIHHKVALPMTDANKKKLIARDIDAIVKTGTEVYALASVVVEMMTIRRFPTEDDIATVVDLSQYPADYIRI